MKRVHYVTLSDMMTMIRNNIWKIPHDIDFIISVPRSGTIPASVIAEFINVPLIDLNSFCLGAPPTGGNRLNFVHRSIHSTPKVLVVDDTVFSGTAMTRARQRLQPLSNKYNFIYCSAYLEGKGKNTIDIYLDDVTQYSFAGTQVVYEWNIFHHYSHIMDYCIYDLDGVFCLDPPDDRNTEEYESYIKDATPLFCPTTTVGKICTYRIDKYRDITTEWLTKNGISYKDLIMFNAQSREERNNSGIGPAHFKGEYFRNDSNAVLFVESDDWQAQEIHRISGKQVLCTSTNKIYE